MKIVIDIPEDMYESIKQLKIQYPRGSAKANQLDFYYVLLNCLKQGIPLSKGHWKVVSDGYGDKAYICECSECKDTIWVYKDTDRKWNYCPNCGADMRGDD